MKIPVYDHIRILFILLAGICFLMPVQAQLTDIARVEYTYFPQSSSENSFKRFRTLFNYPIKVGSDKYIVTGVEYSNVNMELNDPYPFQTGEFDRLQRVQFSVGYTFVMKNGWRFGAVLAPQVASNFQGGIVPDDWLLNASVYFLRRKDTIGDFDRSGQLVLGIEYNTNSGIPFPLPYVNFHKDVGQRWAYTLGVPKTNLKYKLDQKNVLQAFVTLDGFFANIQQNFAVDDRTAHNISMTTVLSGVGYEHFFSEHILFYLYTGYTFINDIELRDKNFNRVFTINDSNTLYLRTGLKLKY
ncbi:DUF6268 family outer membrane beta-barrel protein [Robertkochia aurantiaca]|uniref:DUF6268 family outer membrane beta-barrel protein n=1 Tax=Robertkochia aurantiaca TaxID=2873700 RepID=UPI001CC97DA1|nr:DUF6268 family outer membrane beta-barrel protein [Robertkochia sp. 3YJGBD-33]